jgi:hypothetical protein
MMLSHHGEYTRRIAQKLRENLKIRYPKVEVRYDHGDTSTDQDVRQPTAYLGRRYGTDATLAGIDIVVLMDDRIVVAIEVEESWVRPKTILGDVFGTVLGVVRQ